MFMFFHTHMLAVEWLLSV